MTVDEAIVGLEDLLVDDSHFDPERRRKAIKLGCEALKYVKDTRLTYDGVPLQLLPGETEK